MMKDWKILLCIELLCLLIVIVSGCEPRARAANEEAKIPSHFVAYESDASVASSMPDASSDVLEGTDVSDDLQTLSKPLGLLSDGALILSEEACTGNDIQVPEWFLRTNYTIWHLCFQIQDLSELGDDRLDLRVEEVRFYVGHGGNLALEPIVVVTSPSGYHEWTANILVALPTEWTVPRFNVQQTTVEGPPSLDWALDGDGYGSLRRLGWFFAWRVDSFGHQTDIPMQPMFSTCDGLTRPMNFPAGNFVPEGECPPFLRSCTATGEYYCLR